MQVSVVPRLFILTIALGLATSACSDDSTDPVGFSQSTWRLQAVWQGVPSAGA